MTFGPFWQIQLMHNANLLFMVTELLLNGAPVLPSHVAFAVLFGVWYEIFSWWWVHQTGVVYYAFLDPTLPPHKSCLILLALLAVLATFYSLGAYLAAFFASSTLPLAYRGVLVYAGSCSICWTSVFRGVPAPLKKA
jgi:hypothetical protein